MSAPTARAQRRRSWKRALRWMMMAVGVIIAVGFVFPDPFRMPVEGTGNSSFDLRSFWFFPWGKSVTHKGVDIFAQAGTPVRASVSGIVLFTGEWGRGGNVVFALGPKWRIHYYAHLKEIRTSRGAFVDHDDLIGTVGNTGNAAGKPAHLHYAIISLFPRPWKNDSGPQGWRKMWYVDPTPLLAGGTKRRSNRARAKEVHAPAPDTINDRPPSATPTPRASGMGVSTGTGCLCEPPHLPVTITRAPATIDPLLTRRTR